jgi:hypothetical protein
MNEQKAVRVDSQFLAAGVWRGAFFDQTLGFIFQDEGRGEPYDGYVDAAFGNADGTLTPDEWNRWAGSFEGRFDSTAQLYQFLRTETVNVNLNGANYNVPAYPGFQDCPVDLPADLSKCGALNARYGKSTQLEPPRTSADCTEPSASFMPVSLSESEAAGEVRTILPSHTGRASHARTNALMNLPSTIGAMAAASTPSRSRSSRASSTR